MGTFLLLLFIFFFVIPLIRGVYAFYVMRRKVRDAMNSMYNGQAPGQAQEREPRKGGWTAPRQRRKKIGRDVGEYVRFEEITVVASETQSDTDGKRAGFTVESQISDADWEDIK